jgi:hypothetical protein
MAFVWEMQPADHSKTTATARSQPRHSSASWNPAFRFCFGEKHYRQKLDSSLRWNDG